MTYQTAEADEKMKIRDKSVVVCMDISGSMQSYQADVSEGNREFMNKRR